MKSDSNSTLYAYRYTAMYKQHPEHFDNASVAMKSIFEYTILLLMLAFSVATIVVLRRHTRLRKAMNTNVNTDAAQKYVHSADVALEFTYVQGFCCCCSLVCWFLVVGVHLCASIPLLVFICAQGFCCFMCPCVHGFRCWCSRVWGFSCWCSLAYRVSCYGSLVCRVSIVSVHLCVRFPFLQFICIEFPLLRFTCVQDFRCD